MDFIGERIIILIAILTPFIIFYIYNYTKNRARQEIIKNGEAIDLKLKEKYPNATKVLAPITNDGSWTIIFNPESDNKVHKIDVTMDSENIEILSEYFYIKCGVLDYVPEYLSCIKEYHFNGNLESEKYMNKDIKDEGIWKFYDEDGTLIKEEEYHNDKLIKTKQYKDDISYEDNLEIDENGMIK